jgi:hypothetical protein
MITSLRGWITDESGIRTAFAALTPVGTAGNMDQRLHCLAAARAERRRDNAVLKDIMIRKR